MTMIEENKQLKLEFMLCQSCSWN